ncbi:unnamed protein product [Darwinula stevensoni]|uniref:Uncharacterized protein n=1 Tax=Darwinula stevensoni TaxID=69355 RepID=A0A7R8X4A7_9CRUS|nr:unnamed protein product [Darwinula stevensoni]CAG0885818.1 unnamed protein product [Darwinula stevensoni]
MSGDHDFRMDDVDILREHPVRRGPKPKKIHWKQRVHTTDGGASTAEEPEVKRRAEVLDEHGKIGVTISKTAKTQERQDAGKKNESFFNQYLL